MDWANFRAGLLDGVPQGQEQDDLDDLDESYESYDTEDVTDATHDCDQRQINQYLERRVKGMNNRMSSVLAGIQLIQDMLTNHPPYACNPVPSQDGDRTRCHSNGRSLDGGHESSSCNSNN